MKQTNSHVTRRMVLGALGAALFLPRTAFGAELATVSGRAFGTTWSLVAPRGADLEPLMRDIDNLFARVDRRFSPWRPDSALARFNAMPAALPLRDGEFADVTAAALAIARHSGGAFDPTVGPLVARWGFGPIRNGGRPDWRGVDVGAQMVRKTRDDLTLDLCGIAKGRALDQAGACVAAAGIDGFLFELGGEILVRGRHPDGRDWRIAIDAPAEFAEPSPAIRLPPGAAVATSGHWLQGYRLADRQYGHIIDPGTGEPVSDALRSVTVLAEDAMSADGWATALFAAGARDGLDIAAAQNIQALFLIEENGVLRSVTTGAIGELLL